MEPTKPKKIYKENISVRLSIQIRSSPIVKKTKYSLFRFISNKCPGVLLLKIT